MVALSRMHALCPDIWQILSCWTNYTATMDLSLIARTRAVCRLAQVESHSINQDEMLFMDWRDAHLDPLAKERNRSLPTFLYVMPFSPTRIFAEETSLVARPGVDFDDIKIRMQQRLAGLGIKVTRVLEEEHCFIPMGGVLPRQLHAQQDAQERGGAGGGARGGAGAAPEGPRGRARRGDGRRPQPPRLGAHLARE